MACKANYAYIRGHGHNMEGPPCRVVSPNRGHNMENPLRLPVHDAARSTGKYMEKKADELLIKKDIHCEYSGPASRGNLENAGSEFDDWKKCSRLKMNDSKLVADHLYENVDGVMKARIDGDTTRYRNQVIMDGKDAEPCSLNMIHGLNNDQHRRFAVVGNVDRDNDARDQQEDDYGRNAWAFGVGLGDSEDHESQVVPASNDDHVSPGTFVQVQNRKILVEAAEACQKLKGAVAGANDMLDRLKKPGSMVSDDLITDMELHMGNSIRWLVEQIEVQEIAYRETCKAKLCLEEKVERLAEDRSQLVAQLAREKKSGRELGQIEQMQLEFLGVKDIPDLINQYRLLQIEVNLLKVGKDRIGMSRAGSVGSIASTQASRPVKLERKVPLESLTSLIPGVKTAKENVQDKQGSFRRLSANIPRPPPFKGKTRVELERFFRYFEPYAESIGMDNDGKAMLVGYFVPTLLPQHDSLMQRKLGYEDMKRELLNALGSDSSAATYSLRTALDKYVKAPKQSYREALEEVESKVLEAYGGNQAQREDELKKILLRLTQEDWDTSFSTTVIPHTAANYYRLKELVLSTEDAHKLRKQNNERKHAFDRNHVGQSFKGDRYQQKDCGTSFPWHEKSSVGVDANHQRNDNTGPWKREQNSSSVKCYTCGKPGHSAKDCIAQAEAQLVQEEEKSFEFVVHGIVPVNAVNNASDNVKLFGDRTLLETQFDGVKVVAMLDSGACVSVISSKALHKILGDGTRTGKITREPSEVYKSSSLVGANGSKLNVVDCVRIPVAWGKYSPSPALFFVVAGLQQEVLIGTNIIKDNPVWLHGLKYALNAKESIRSKTRTKQINQVEQLGGNTPSKSADVVGLVGVKVDTAQKVEVLPAIGEVRSGKMVEPSDKREKDNPVYKGVDPRVRREKCNASNAQITSIRRGRESVSKVGKTEVRSLPSRHYKSVVVGGANAKQLAHVIGAAYWSIKSVDDLFVRGQVNFGEKIKNIFFFPHDEFVYSTSITFFILKQLEKINHAKLILLPALRKDDTPVTNEQFAQWCKINSIYSQMSAKQPGHGLQTNPLDRAELQNVDSNALLTQNGAIKLVEYLNANGCQLKLVNQSRSSQHHRKWQNALANSFSSSKSTKSLPLQQKKPKKCYSCQAPDHLVKECPRQGKLQGMIPKNKNYRGR